MLRIWVTRFSYIKCIVCGDIVYILVRYAVAMREDPWDLTVNLENDILVVIHSRSY